MMIKKHLKVEDSKRKKERHNNLNVAERKLCMITLMISKRTFIEHNKRKKAKQDNLNVDEKE